MKDTSPEVEKIFNDMLMKKSDAKRLIMGCGMFGDAVRIIKSSILNENPKISLRELQKEIFLRLYKSDFTEKELDKIVSSL